MEKQFTLRLHNPTKSTLGFLLALPTVFGATAFVSRQFSLKPGPDVWAVVVLVVGGVTAYFFIKWWAGYSVLASVDEQHICVRYLKSGEMTRIPFPELLSYRRESVGQRQELRFKLVDGRRVRLAVNELLGKTGDFPDFSRAVKQAIEKYDTAQSAAILREFTFFERPISTIVLVLVTGLIPWLIWKIVYDHKPVSGSVISAFGSYLAYLSAWLAATKRRNQVRR